MRKAPGAVRRALTLIAFALACPASALDTGGMDAPVAAASDAAGESTAAPAAAAVPTAPAATPAAPADAPAPAAAPAPAPQQRAAPEPLWGAISELRFGVLGHDISFPGPRNLVAPDPFHHRYEGGVNLNAEILFRSPRVFRYVLSPRPRIGGSANTLGLTSYAYADLDWGYQFRFGLFTEAFLGGAVHTGKLRDGNPRWAELGSRFLFHIGFEVGWRLFRHHGLSIFYEHISNNAFAKPNQGLDSLGLRYGYRFDA